MLQETHIMEARELYKSYGRRQVLAGVDFRLEPGEMLGIIGENGAGKTTLLRVLAGELRPDRGEVTVNGTLGYCPQRIVLNDELTVEQHLHFFRHAYRIQRLGRAYELVETLGYTRYLKARAGTLSGGTRQKLNLTIALMHEPDVVLMDEPYQGFDWQNYLNFWTIAEDLRLRGCAVLVISHIAHDTQRFDRLFHLRAGMVQPAEARPADQSEDSVSTPEGAAA